MWNWEKGYYLIDKIISLQWYINTSRIAQKVKRYYRTTRIRKLNFIKKKLKIKKRNRSWLP